MSSNRKILIVKHGALGDVVRTSYIPKYIKIEQPSTEIHWITASLSIDLLRFNPYIDKLICDFNSISHIEYDIIYSLDDESEIVENVMKLKHKSIVGLQKKDNYLYCSKSSKWFDMGLRSKFSKKDADLLKLKNTLTHTQIFKEIFDINKLLPNFYHSPYYIDQSISFFNSHENDFIGINAFAGGRWKSKELLIDEYENLIKLILSKSNVNILLIGAFDDLDKNIRIKQKINNKRVFVLDSNDSILKMAAYISNLKILISTDSLALHLAIANNIYNISFYSPTSASEIDTFENGQKIISTSYDYCSYKKNADNKSITANIIFDKIKNII